MKQKPPSRESWAATLRANAEQANARRDAKPRNRALVVVDIVVAVLLVLIDLGIAILVAGSATQYSGITLNCSADQLVGLACNRTVIDVVSIGLLAVAILGFVLAAGMVLVNIIRRRWTFWWPLGAGVVMVGLFWLGTWLVGMTIPDGLTS